MTNFFFYFLLDFCPKRITNQPGEAKGSSNKTYDFHNPYTVKITWTPRTHPQILTGTKINSYTCKTRSRCLLKYLIIPLYTTCYASKIPIEAIYINRSEDSHFKAVTSKIKVYELFPILNPLSELF